MPKEPFSLFISPTLSMKLTTTPFIDEVDGGEMGKTVELMELCLQWDGTYLLMELATFLLMVDEWELMVEEQGRRWRLTELLSQRR